MAAVNPSMYADSFAQARSPPSVFTAVSTRLGVQRALTADLAAFLHERALVEEHYIRQLEKLGSRLHSQQKDALFREQQQLALSQRDQDRALGQQWATLRRTIESDLAETARVHDRWRAKVDKEVAQPLRDSLAKGDWARWNQQEQNLAAQVKEYDALVDKVQKAQQKSTKSGKSASSKQLQSQSALASLGSSLTSALPAFLSQSQQLDLAHGALLKQHLVLCGTHTSDLGRDRMEAGERLLNQVLAVDEGAEAQEWALREGQRLGGGAGGQASSQLATVGEFGEAPSNGGVARADSLLDRDDAASTVSGATGVSRSRTISRPTASSTAPPPAVPLPLPTAADADTRSVRSSSNTSKPTSKLGSKFSAILGGGGGSSSSSSSKRDRSSSIPNSAKYANFAGSSSDAPPVPPVQQQQQQPSFARRETDASSLSGNGGDLLGGRSGAGALAPPLQPESRDKRKSLMPGSGGSGGGLFRRASRANTLQDDEGTAAYQQQQQAQYASGPMSAEPLGGAGAGAGAGAGGAPSVDAEGYSLPPDGYDRAIGDSGAGARGASRNLMDDEDEDDLPLSSSVPKLSIAPSPLPPSSPTMPQEDEQARLAALESVKSALGAPAGGLGRRTTTNRGRRGTDPASASASPTASSAQRNTLYAPNERQDSTLSSVSATSEDDTPLAQVAEKHRRAPPPPPTARATSPNGARPLSAFVASPTVAGGESPFTGSSSGGVSAANAVVAPPLASPTGSSSGFGSSGAFSPAAVPGRTMSVLSATSSLGSSAHPAGGAGASSRPDPFAHATAPGLRASVTESVSALLKGGEVTRALVTGEVALSHRSAASVGEEVQLRVTGLDGAEKVAPNTTFLHPSSAGTPGEFSLASSFAATTAGSTTPVLKYALSASSSSVIPPLSVKPTWRVEPGLARAIVAYAPLAQSPLVSQGAQVDDVRIELHLASGTISSFQAKPQAQMLPSGKGIVFSLPAGAAQSDGKLLASLVTVSEGGAPAQPGNVVVHWVVRGATAGRVGVERVEGGELDELRREVTSGKYLAA
ncbi:uncharacterized protein RHOBADRAFT_56144 [Rhodotorula graminis WP1]|uniref:MHD domain-containing protein n=1 Tax=Rhodotorula graminis (strain WP1) TaxID=578459 RepID=A0A0P9EK16_RHOGW|nr:uncharacterized protein RHOBADRAFT_56144 [Rhodotorula graminis WP1]KPV72007.1 hypothetical protein RHOBADRAFT_56144 [Rhodotorula graminis WP1]